MKKLTLLFLLTFSSIVFAVSEKETTDPRIYNYMSRLIEIHGIHTFGNTRTESILKTKGKITDECRTQLLDATYDKSLKRIKLIRQFNLLLCAAYFKKYTGVAYNADELSASLQRGVVFLTCNNSVDRAGLDAGISFEFVYRTEKGQTIADVIVDANSCKGF